MEPQRESLKRLAVDQAMGHFLVGPIKAYIFSTLLLDYGLQDLDTHKLPTLKETILTLLLFNVINDVLLYIFHRMLHSKLLYKPLHKKHHEFSGSVGYAAEYSTPVEQVVANQLPAFAGLFVNVTVWQTKCHFLLFWIWIALRLHETYTSHSGYTASQARRGTNPITSSPHYWTRACQIAHHDYHHTHNVGNFGALWVDWICGTMDHYQSIGGFDGYLQLKEKEANHK